MGSSAGIMLLTLVTCVAAGGYYFFQMPVLFHRPYGFYPPQSRPPRPTIMTLPVIPPTDVYQPQPSIPPPPRHITAKVVMEGKVQGQIKLEDTGKETIITGTVWGLSPGLHGFHVHEKGDLGDNCKNAGGHFNPDKNNHGAPTVQNRHAGDLGNIESNELGVAYVNIVDSFVRLDGGRYDVSGRAIVVHRDADDLGRGGFNDSLTTGHAGPRLACGVITLDNPPYYY